MRCKPAAQHAAAAPEQHVRHFLGIDRHDTRRVAADFLQSAGEPFRLPRELYGRRVREPLALPRYGRLDEPREQHADTADDREAGAQRDCRGDATAVAATARPRVPSAAQQPTPGEREDENAEGEADQLLVEPHVAVQDVAELVGDDALELVALEMLEGAARHGD